MRKPFVVAALAFALGCGTTSPAGNTDDEPGPCGTASPDARVCAPGESCLDGVCTPWVGQTLVEGVECGPALGDEEVFFFAEGELRAVPKAGGTVRSLGPARGRHAGSCGSGLRADGSWVFVFDNGWRDNVGGLFGYPLAGGGPVLLTPDERLVYGATVLGDRVYLAVGDFPSELLEVDPSAPAAPRIVLSTPIHGRFADLERMETGLFVFEERRVVRGGPDEPSTVFRVSPGGIRDPPLAEAAHGWLEADHSGRLILGTNACDHGGLLEVRRLSPGASGFTAPVGLGCNFGSLVLDDVYAFLRVRDDLAGGVLRHPLAGGEATRVHGSEALWSVFGVDDAWLYGTRDGAIVRIPK